MKPVLIFFTFFSFIICGCKSNVDPICWCGKETGTIFPTPFCSPNPYNAILILDDNPSDTLMIINSIPDKLLTDTIRVKVKYRIVEMKGAIFLPCVIYKNFIKISCISRE